MVIFIAFFAKSAQLSALGKAAIIAIFFNINEPILFGMPVVYNPYTAIPFFLAPMVSMSVAYFGINLGFVNHRLLKGVADPNWIIWLYWFRW